MGVHPRATSSRQAVGRRASSKQIVTLNIVLSDCRKRGAGGVYAEGTRSASHQGLIPRR